MPEDLEIRKRIAEELLGHPLDADGYAQCPGQALHHNANGRRDFRIILTDVPTAFCLHASCAGIIDQFNFDLRSRIGKAESGGGWSGQASPLGAVPREPEPPRGPKRPPYDPAKLAEFAKGTGFPITFEWLAARSRVPIPDKQDLTTTMRFLDSIYQPGEKVLVFVRAYSQGCFLYHVGKQTYRLGRRMNVKAVPSPLPAGGEVGVWFLPQPVSGRWEPNPNNRDEQGAPKMGRRHGACIESWRFMVLESDEAPPELWMRALVQFPLPICAIYTSGGRSIHALAKVNARTKQEWDALRDSILPVLSSLGADPATLTAVRLTRLPGTLRHGCTGKDGKRIPYPEPALQRLLYLNPRATATPIIELA